MTHFHRITSPILALLAILTPAAAFAAGTLTPVGSPDQPMRIVDHHVRVVINNGFAMTEVTQTFLNPNASAVEALYSFPVPESASLSEMSITAGETELNGEVVARAEAERIYQEERDSGGDAGLATKESYQRFEFRVASVPPGDSTTVRFLYYQPLAIDTGVGRYLYPLEEGDTDELAKSFWTRNEVVDGTFSAEVVLKSAWPVADLRVPGFEASAAVDKKDDQTWQVQISQAQASLNKDLVVYYRLADNLPGRVELIPYREDPSKPGTFMMVITPGIDLAPITSGSDFVFVLDTSGSMSGKLATLADSVVRSLGELRNDDRFRIITFSSKARELTSGWQPATEESVRHWASTIEQLDSGGSTNLHAGLKLAFRDLDDDRATSVLLVTDGVTNTGVVEPAAFHKLMKSYDVRVYGFLLGNSANWPLMKVICDASGGFYAPISNADDVLGQIMLAKSKIGYEVLHDVDLKISGAKVSDVNDSINGKVYRGQQLVLFGRYHDSGPAKVTLEARLTGADTTYSADFYFPDVATDHPELERLWAMSTIEELEQLASCGLMDPAESDDAVQSLGVEYQLVTDHTAMIVLRDEVFEQRGMDRRNQQRIAREHSAQAKRAQQPVTNHRVDTNKPMFDRPAPSLGGGAVDPIHALLALAAGLLAVVVLRRSRAAA